MRYFSSRSQIALKTREPRLHDNNTHLPVVLCRILTISEQLLQTRPDIKNARARRRDRRANKPDVQAKTAEFWKRTWTMQQAALNAALDQSTAAQQAAKQAEARVEGLAVRVEVLEDCVHALAQERDDALALLEGEKGMEWSMPVTNSFKISVRGQDRTPADLATSRFGEGKLLATDSTNAKFAAETRSVQNMKHFLVMACKLEDTARAAGIEFPDGMDLSDLATLILDKALTSDRPLEIIGAPTRISIHTASKIHATMPLQDPNDPSKKPLLWSSQKAAMLQDPHDIDCAWIRDPRVYESQKLVLVGCSVWGPAAFQTIAKKAAGCCGQGQIGLFPTRPKTE